MRRNSGVIGAKKTVALDNASGVHDRFDAFNHRKNSVWPRWSTMTVGAIDMKQNQSVTVNVSSTGNIDNGTYWWTLDSLPADVTNSAQLTATSGSFTITSGSGSFTVTSTLKSSFFTTDQSFTVNVRLGSTTGTIVGTSSGIIRGATVSLSIPTTVNEASTFTVTASWTGLATNSGSNYAWTWQTNQSNGSTPIEFKYNNSIYTQLSISNINSSTSISNSNATVMPDYLTTTGRTFSVSLLMNGNIVKTSNTCTVSNTITSSALSVSVPNVNEGEQATITISGVEPYARLNIRVWKNDGNGNNQVSSSTYYANSSGYMYVYYTPEYQANTYSWSYNIKIYDYTGNNLILNSGSGTINDLTPSITSSSFTNTVNETGTQFLVTLGGSNLYNKTFNWTVIPVGGTVDALDFDALSGSVTSSFNSQFDIPLTIKADATTEGSESFYLDVKYAYDNSQMGNSVFGLSSLAPITINDSSKAPIVGPGFILSTAIKYSEFPQVYWSDGAGNYNGTWIRLYKKVSSTQIYLQGGRRGTYDTPQIYLNGTNTASAYAQYVSGPYSSNQYPTASGWNISRPNFKDDGSKAWFFYSNRIYEYVPSSANGNIGLGLFDLNSYSSLNYVNAYPTYSPHGLGDVAWNADGTAMWVSYATNSYQGYMSKIVYDKFPIVNGGTPYNYQHLSSTPSANAVLRDWNNSSYWDCAEFQFNHDGTQIYFRHGNGSTTITNKIEAYTLTTPYDIASGATNGTFTGVTPAQEWVVTTPQYSSFNPGRIKSFFFDNQDWNQIYIAWANDNYNYASFSVYNVDNPAPASPVSPIPEFKLTSATLANTTVPINVSIGYTNRASIVSAYSPQYGRGLMIPMYGWNGGGYNTDSGNRYYKFYNVSTTSSTATDRSNTQYQTAYPNYNFTWYHNPTNPTQLHYIIPNTNGSGILFYTSYLQYPYGFPDVYQIGGGPNIQLTLPSGYDSVNGGGQQSMWISSNTSTNVYKLYFSYIRSNGPYNGAIVSWTSSSYGQWSGTATLEREIANGYYSDPWTTGYKQIFRFNTDGTKVTMLGQTSTFPISMALNTYTCSTPYMPPADPLPTPVYSLATGLNPVHDFIFDYQNMDAIYVYGQDTSNSSYTLKVYNVPLPYLDWSTYQPVDTNVKTLGALIVTSSSSSSFSIFFDTVAHATTFETLLKAWLDIGFDNSSSQQSYITMAYGGRVASISITGSTAGKSSYVTRTSKTVTYNSVSLADTSVSTPTWDTSSPINKIGFRFYNSTSGEKIIYDSAKKGVSMNFTNIHGFASALNTANVGVLTVDAAFKTKYLKWNVLTSNDNGYLNSQANDYIGMSFTEAPTEPYSYWGSQYQPNDSALSFTLADAKGATTDAPAYASALTVTVALMPASTNQSGPSSYDFTFSSDAKATAFYNAVNNYLNMVAISWKTQSGTEYYEQYPSSATMLGTKTVSLGFNSLNGNYSPWGESYSSYGIKWKFTNIISYIGQNPSNPGGPIDVGFSGFGSQVGSALVAGTLKFTFAEAQNSNNGQGYYTSSMGTTTYMFGSYNMAGSWTSIPSYQVYGNWFTGKLAANVPAALITTDYPIYYASYDGMGSIYLDFSSPSQRDSVLMALSNGAKIITLNWGPGQQSTWTSATTFSSGNWQYGPNGYGIYISTAGSTLTGYTPYGNQSMNYSAVSITALAELVVFTLPYNNLLQMYVPPSYYGSLSLTLNSAADANAFKTYLESHGVATYYAYSYESYNGSSRSLTIYYNPASWSISVGGPSGNVVQMYYQNSNDYYLGYGGGQPGVIQQM